MTSSPGDGPKKKGKKVRVPFRRNRNRPRRRSDITQQARQAEGYDLELVHNESVVARGDQSRQRTIIVGDEAAAAKLRPGVVMVVRGLYADVDDGQRIWSCTVSRILRTRLIEERHPITTGDRVRFHLPDVQSAGVTFEGVIEDVGPRHGELKRKTGKRIHTIVANVDQAIIVSAAREPMPKPHLIDRYIVACGAGGITPIICLNKVDLDGGGIARELLDSYAELGYPTLAVSAATGEGVDELRSALKDKESVIAGQSGVGKSSLLNAVQPGLELKVGDIIEQTEKGRHTTTTATLIRLDMGGYVVDTPGIRSFDLTAVSRGEFEAHFLEFLPFLSQCKFADCTHTHETDCAIKDAVESGEISIDRYESYVHMFEEPGAGS